jgi:hypothetical protein
MLRSQKDRSTLIRDGFRAGIGGYPISSILGLRHKEHKNGVSGKIWRALVVLGVVRNRSLIVNDLINLCDSPSDISRSVLLDVDVSGLPRDVEGLIRTGVPSVVDVDMAGSVIASQAEVHEYQPAEGISLHIEAD